MNRFINEKIKYEGTTIIKCVSSSVRVNCPYCFLYNKLNCYHSISLKRQIFGNCAFKTIYKKFGNY